MVDTLASIARPVLARVVPNDAKPAFVRAHMQLRRIAARRRKLNMAPTVSLRLFGEADHDVFFGYYDVTPFSENGRRMLACRRPYASGGRAAGTELALGVYTLDGPSHFEPFAATTAWCWQQGCRLQWMPRSQGKEVLYNRSRAGGHEAAIQNVETGAVARTYGRPIYALSRDGRLGLSLDFVRLQRLRPGYGYDNARERSADVKAPEDNGLWLVDMETGRERLVLSLAAAAAMAPQASMAEAEHYFNHACWNPSSTRFMVFHIWQRDGRRRIRVITGDAAGGDLYLLTNDEHVSHYCWLSDDALLLYGTPDGQDEGFHVYRDRAGYRRAVGSGILREDGHPSLRPGANMLVVDTYPDAVSERALYLYDLDGGKRSELGTFYSPPDLAEERRCDLHPRWSACGNMIAVDTAHEGRRQMALLEIPSA